MYKVDVYLRVRRAVMVDGMSIREASRVFGLHRDTVRKMLVFSARIPHLAQTSDAVNRQLSCVSSRYMNLLAVFQI